MIFVLQHQDSYRLTDFIVSWCNHRIVNVLWIWVALPSCFSEHNFNTLRIRAVLSLFHLFTLRMLTRAAPEFSHNSGCKQFSPWENEPWSNNKDYLLSEAENGHSWSNNHNEVCSEMGGSCWIFFEFSLDVTAMEELYRAWYSCLL